MGCQSFEFATVFEPIFWALPVYASVSEICNFLT